MNVRKLIFTGSATALGLGLAGIPAAAFADDSPSLAPTSQPTVTQSAGTFTVTLPGVGSLSFGVDPTSGAITALTVAPAQGSGFTAGTPMTTEEGVEVLFTGTSGSQLLEVKVDRDEAVTEVKAEVEGPPPAPQAAGAPGDDQGDNQGETTTTAPGTPTTGDDGGMESGDGTGTETEPGDDNQSTTTTVPGATTPNNSGDESGSSDNGSDGGGSDGGGSGSGGSSDGGSGSGSDSSSGGDSGSGSGG